MVGGRVKFFDIVALIALHSSVVMTAELTLMMKPSWTVDMSSDEPGMMAVEEQRVLRDGVFRCCTLLRVEAK